MMSKRLQLVIGTFTLGIVLAACSDGFVPEAAKPQAKAPAEAGSKVVAAAPDSSAVAAQPAAPVGVTITNWGPAQTAAGEGFNVQPNGDSAIWFQASGVGGGHSYELQFGNHSVTQVAIVEGKGGSAQIPPVLIRKPGKYPVALVEKRTGKRYELGIFEVLPKA